MEDHSSSIRRINRLAAAQPKTEQVAQRFDEKLTSANPKMLEAIRIIRLHANSNLSVFIMGPRGVGKERLAEALHYSGKRCNEPFVVVHGAAIPTELFESQVFGHLKGAFTDAKSDLTGLIELARRGTVFFDEVGDMPVPVQAKLLRVIENKRIRPLGSKDEKPIDFRIVCATNSDPAELIKTQRLKEDFFDRICGVPVRVPPLNERVEDIAFLLPQLTAEACLEYNRPSPHIEHDALQILLTYEWPGNVRQLKTCVSRAVFECENGIITYEYLHSILPNSITPKKDLEQEKCEFERRRIIQALLTSENDAEAAKKIGYKAAKLKKKKRKLKINSRQLRKITKGLN